MRVLQVCSAESIGGGEIHVADLARALAARGIEVEIAVRPSSPLPGFAGEIPGAVWHHVPLRNALDLGSVRALARLVAERAIDVVHAHVARDYPVAALALGAADRGRLVLTRHHYLPIKGNVLYRKLLARATVIAVSESVRATVLESLRLPPDRVVTIPNWIDLERYAEARDRGAERGARGVTRRVAVGVVGQLVALKGQEEFLRAAAIVARDRHDVEFLLAGEDRDRAGANEARLRELARTLGIEDRVRFLGHESDLPGLLAALDVVCVPSRNEAFSLATTEAMAAGRPVVASRVGALAELVSDGETGLLVAPGDPEALAAAIARLAADPALADRLGRTARTDAVRFARDPRVDRVVALYRTVMADAETG